jgi:hypothetical protein
MRPILAALLVISWPACALDLGPGYNSIETVPGVKVHAPKPRPEPERIIVQAPAPEPVVLAVPRTIVVDAPPPVPVVQYVTPPPVITERTYVRSYPIFIERHRPHRPQDQPHYRPGARVSHQYVGR